MSSIGERLRIARTRKNLKQTDVRAKTGINNKTLSGYENGVSEPDIDSLNILAGLYEVTVDWLTGNTAEPTSATNSIASLLNDPDLSEDDKEIVLQIISLPDEKKGLIKNLLKAFESDADK